MRSINSEVNQDIRLESTIAEHKHNEDASTGRMVVSSGAGEFVLEYKVRLVDLDLKTPKLDYWLDLDTRIRAQEVIKPRNCIE